MPSLIIRRATTHFVGGEECHQDEDCVFDAEHHHEEFSDGRSLSDDQRESSSGTTHTWLL